MAADFGMKFGLHLETDSSAAKGVAQRRGVGRIRHLHTPLLWIQRKVKQGLCKVWKIDGKQNEADVGTKPLGQQSLIPILQRLGFVFEQGRSSQALKAAQTETAASTE